MVPPSWWNMLLFRGCHGRARRWGVDVTRYDMPGNAFGRVPIVIKLGDFLQKKPVGSKISLVTDVSRLSVEVQQKLELPVEAQQSMKLFVSTPHVFEFLESNRFKDERLKSFMAYMRAPTVPVPASIEALWESMRLVPGDTRLSEPRFQQGHMIGIYWATVSRWMMMRAKRDAAAAAVPLYLVQAADRSVSEDGSRMPRDIAAKLLNTPNPKNTGMMHGMLLVHVGMRIRLLHHMFKYDRSRGLVKDAEGDVVKVVLDPREEEGVRNAIADGRSQIYLRYLPLGIWVRMCKYDSAPFCDTLEEHDARLASASTRSLVFVEPKTAEPFLFRGFRVSRTAFPLSHGKVVTSTACQGRTYREGVVIDCGRLTTGKTALDDDDLWLDLYVMLSRATRSDDLLLLRQPDLEFLARGPPTDLKEALTKFEARTEECRLVAERAAERLRFSRFLR